MLLFGAVKNFEGNPGDRAGALFAAPVAAADLPRTGQNVLFKIMGCLEVSAFFGKLIDDAVTECNAGEPQKLRIHPVGNASKHDGGDTEKGDIVVFNAQSLREFRAVVSLQFGHKLTKIPDGDKFSVLPRLVQSIRHFRLEGNLVLADDFGDVVVDNDDIFYLHILKIESFKNMELGVYHLLNQFPGLVTAGSYAAEKLIEAQDAQQDILGQDKTVLGKEGDLNAAASDIYDGGPLLNDAVEIFAL